MSFNQAYVNKIVGTKQGSSSMKIYALPGRDSKVLLTLGPGQVGGRSTGSYTIWKGENFYQVSLYSAINGRKYGYFLEEDTHLTQPPAKANKVAEANSDNLMKDLIKNDQDLMKSLLVNGILLKTAKNKGIDTSKQEQQLNSIIATYNARQEKIRTSTLISIKNGVDSVSNWLIAKWKSFVSGIGIAPIIVAVIAFGVGLGAAALIYYAFKPDYDTSKENLKSSKELEKALANLTPQEAVTLKTDLEKQIDNAYNQGKTDESFSGFFGNIKTVLLLALGAGAAYYVVTKTGKK